MSALPVLVAVGGRTLRKTAARPAALMFSFVQPAIWVLFFGFLFQRFDAGTGDAPARYLDFVVAGVCAMTVLFGASQSGIGMLRDLMTGFLQRMLRTPASIAAIAAGKVAADALRLVAQAIAIALLGAAVGARLQWNLDAIAAMCGAFALFAVALCSVSCIVAVIAKSQESMASFVHLVNMPLLFTSTALVPSRQMPDWLAAISQWNPLTLAVDIARAALRRGEVAAAPGAWIVLATLAAVALTALALVLRRLRVDAA